MSSMNAGGAETFLMKQYRLIDREKYQLDFCVNVQERGFYDDEIEALGGKIYRIAPKSQNFKKSLKDLENIVKENGYENVLVSSVNPGTALELLAAKRGGAKRLIYRSSNSSVDGGFKQKLLHHTVGRLAHTVPTVKIAPSVLAAEYCFGKGCVANGKANILNNGIDTSFYRYSDEKRQNTRAELGLSDDEFAVIHIGRFAKAKNHSFLLEIFAEIIKRNLKAKLFLIGAGELEAEIRKKAAELSLSDKIFFLGIRKDVPNLLAAGDVFIFPSFYEGMPNTVIEAQALSLHCVIADTITPDAEKTGVVEYLPLGNPKQWADAALKYADGYLRQDMSAIYKAKKYDTESTAEEFIKYCFGESKEKVLSAV